MKNWQRYPEYKDSGVEWLGEIPKHWEVKKLKWLVSKVGSGKTPKGGAEIYSNFGVIFIRSQNVHFDGLKLDDVAYIDDSIDSQMASTRVFPFDILLNITGASLGRCSIVPDGFPPANVNQHVCIIRPIPNLINSKFLNQVISSNAVQRQIFSVEDGVSREGLSFFQIGNLIIILPKDIEEQKAIAHFLDRETNKLDNLIAKKERFIELLQEKRTALISHAVTKGLNPDVPMKDSGISWLGQIPKHWEVMKLKRTANIRYGLGQPPPETINGTPLIRATNIKNGFISENDMLYVDINKIPESRNAILSSGEIIVVRSGAYTGDSAIIPPKYAGAIAGYDMVVKPIRCESQFLAWQFLSLQVRYLQFSFHMLRAAQPHLNAEELKETIITFPSLFEQKAIAQFLDQETTKIDTLIEKTKTSIEKLKEYRTALISAAVTGKIDIRQEII
jgi:type I restriction enzyme S subunit